MAIPAVYSGMAAEFDSASMMAAGERAGAKQERARILALLDAQMARMEHMQARNDIPQPEGLYSQVRYRQYRRLRNIGEARKQRLAALRDFRRQFKQEADHA